MKKINRISLVIFLFCFQTNLFAQNFWVSDVAFRDTLKQMFPSCFTPQDSLITTCPDVMNALSLNLLIPTLQNLDGIQFFKNLNELSIVQNNLSQIDSLPNSLKILINIYSPITSINFYPPNIEEIDLTSCPNFNFATLPNSLLRLNCSSCSLSFLPTLPPFLERLNCYDNQITSFTNLPNTIKQLHCSLNPISFIQYFPDSLMYLDLYYNSKLKSLPAFPNNLRVASLFHDSLTSLPVLPANLEILDCSNNFLTKLPALNNNLKELVCNHNLLTSLPFLKDSITQLDCSYNMISSLPNLPARLARLWCESNPLYCLPILPNTLSNLLFGFTYISCFPNYPPLLSPFLAPLCPPQFPTCHTDKTHGFVFIDTNSNGIMDAGENGFNTIVSATNGAITQSNSNGFFKLSVDTGINTLQIQLPNYYTNTTALSQTITVLSNQIDTVYFGIHPIPNINDLKVSITNVTFLRPGFHSQYKIQYQNVGTTSISNAKIKFLKPAQLSNLSSSAVAAVSGDTLIWTIPFLAFNQGGSIDVWDSVNVNAQLGSIANAQVWINSLATDSIPSDNYFLNSTTISGALDPNDKAVSPQFIAENATDYLVYTIRFQNTGSDTAFNILLTDTLSALLDWSSIIPIAASANCQFDLQNGTAKWYFSHILLPDSNINETASHGFVEFRIKPKNNLTAGTQIKNGANIYFDYNVAVITNTAVVDVTPLGIKQHSETKTVVYPNPAHSKIYIRSENLKPLDKVELLDASGKLLSSKIINAPTVEWNIEEQPKGIYFLKGDNWIEKILKR